MPNAVCTDGAPLTDEARALVLPVRINVPNHYQVFPSLRSKLFVTFGWRDSGECQDGNWRM